MFGFSSSSVFINVVQSILNNEFGRVVEFVHAVKRSFIIEVSYSNNVFLSSDTVPPETMLENDWSYKATSPLLKVPQVRIQRMNEKLLVMSWICYICSQKEMTEWIDAIFVTNDSQKMNS